MCGFCCHVGRIVNSVTKVAAKSTGKKASVIGILINASSLIIWNKQNRIEIILQTINIQLDHSLFPFNPFLALWRS